MGVNIARAYIPAEIIAIICWWDGVRTDIFTPELVFFYLPLVMCGAAMLLYLRADNKLEEIEKKDDISSSN